MSRHSSRSRSAGLSKYSPDVPGVGLWVIAGVVVGLVLLMVFGSVGRAQEHVPTPPIINDIPRRVTNPVLPEPRRTLSEHSTPGDGPMCQAPIPEEYAGPYPTHYGLLVIEPATEAESLEVVRQISSCRGRGVWSVADPYMVLALMRLEKELGAEPGLLASGWCWEANMKPRPRAGDRGASHGFWQMQESMWASCGLPMVDAVTTDLVMSATCFYSRVERQIGFAKEKGCKDPVTVGEAMAANWKKYKGWGCRARSLHADELARWRQVAQ